VVGRADAAPLLDKGSDPVVGAADAAALPDKGSDPVVGRADAAPLPDKGSDCVDADTESPQDPLGASHFDYYPPYCCSVSATVA